VSYQHRSIVQRKVKGNFVEGECACCEKSSRPIRGDCIWVGGPDPFGKFS
jgi:hypothetical protein